MLCHQLIPSTRHAFGLRVSPQPSPPRLDSIMAPDGWNDRYTAATTGGGTGALVLMALIFAASRPGTRAHLRAVFAKAFKSAGGLQSIKVESTTIDANLSPGLPVASMSTVAADAALSLGLRRRSPPLARPGNPLVLLDGTARWRSGLSWWRTVHVQLLAAPTHSFDAPDTTPDTKELPWSALVVDGVEVPYAEVRTVRMDESALEFTFERGEYDTSHADALPDAPQQHLRMDKSYEFNLWRDALHPKITNPRLSKPPGIPAGSTPSLSAVHAAQKWLANAAEVRGATTIIS